MPKVAAAKIEQLAKSGDCSSDFIFKIPNLACHILNGSSNIFRHHLQLGIKSVALLGVSTSSPGLDKKPLAWASQAQLNVG